MEVQSVWGETPLWFIAALVTWKQFSFFLQIWKTSNFTSNFMNIILNACVASFDLHKMVL